jgi:hypothetical protein
MSTDITQEDRDRCDDPTDDREAGAWAAVRTDWEREQYEAAEGR